MDNVSSIKHNNKNVPKLRFPGFEGEWNQLFLDDICCYGKGKKDVPKYFYVSTENILQNFAGIELYKDDTVISGVPFDTNDILIGNIRPYLKKVWMADFDGACSADVLVLHPRNIESHFFYYVIAQEKFITFVMSGVKGSKMPRGDKTQIMEYETFVPSMREQQKIATFLSLIDERISKQRELVEKLKTYKRGLINDIFSRKIRLSKEQRDWRVCRIGDILKILHGRDYKHLSTGKYPVLGTGGIINYVNEYLCDWECVLIGRKGTIDKPQYMDAPFWSVDTLFYSKSKQDQCVKFQYYLFQTINWKLYDDSTGVPSLSASAIENIAISIPNVEEQQKIANFLSEIDIYINNQTEQLSKLISLKSALLQQMFI